MTDAGEAGTEGKEPRRPILTPEQKDRILQEELFRQRLREEIAPVRPRSPILSFLNSPFGLLLMSSIVIAGLGKLYNDVEANRDRDRIRQQQVAKLAVENDFRAFQANSLIADIEKGDRASARQSCADLNALVLGVDRYHSTAVEFSNLRWLGVVTQIGLLANVPTAESRAGLLRLENYVSADCAPQKLPPAKLVQPLQCLTAQAQRAVGQTAMAVPGCRPL